MIKDRQTKESERPVTRDVKVFSTIAVQSALVALVLVALIPVLRVFPVVVLACLVLLPAVYVFAAIVGTFRSSIWTIGYVTQVEA